MALDRSIARIASSISGDRRVPGTTKLGAVVIAFGLLADVVEHDVVVHTGEARIGAFALGEHLAHLIVLVGMVLVLVGIVADGIRSNRRHPRQEGVPRHALR